MLRLVSCLLLTLFAAPVLGHGGGLDQCGGHNDRKRGGYHVHNEAEFCACNPEAAQCRSKAEVQVDKAIAAYKKAASQIEIGASKADVMGILGPIQDDLPPDQGKESEGFMQNGKAFEIAYLRSRRRPNAPITDDDFTPFVFEDAKLVCKGWRCANEYL